MHIFRQFLKSNVIKISHTNYGGGLLFVISIAIDIFVVIKNDSFRTITEK